MVQDTLLYQLAQAGKAQRVFIATKLREVGLHPGQDSVLMLIKEKGSVCLSDLGLLLAIQPPTVTKMTVRLERAGYILRRSSPQDQRKCMIDLTEKGEEKVAELEELWRRADEEAMQGVSPSARAFLGETLCDLESVLYRRAGRWKAYGKETSRARAPRQHGHGGHAGAVPVSVRESAL
ncbi:MarR family winged helix-turn-helix transcriptional regulator [Afifella pfennigii]|uniref:MarR family winged helix-turn-helix transcriptional regulator n=1 Tax=Afifella pfennigii TaxID=209897 RepID=UPI0012EBDF8E|nr:MarR family transcriptional regulator [Afifella pfennigii]